MQMGPGYSVDMQKDWYALCALFGTTYKLDALVLILCQLKWRTASLVPDLST